MGKSAPASTRMRNSAASLCAAIVIVCQPLVSFAETPADFYRGKSITMLVGSGVGGGYDTYARVFARHYTQHIPGNPAIIPKNLPAAAGIAATNTLYNTAERDGLTIAALTNSVALDPLFGNPAARYDSRKLNWLGSIGKLQNVCATWITSTAKTIDDVRARQVIVAAAGATSNTAIVPRVLNALLGTKFKVVAGYDPGSGLTMAVEQGEAEGICGLSWSTMKASRPHWILDHKLNVLVQMGIETVPELPNVPSALDLVPAGKEKDVLRLILLRQEMGRPFAAPPDVPADRVAALQKAFTETLKDPAFVAEANKVRMEIDPMDSHQIAKLLTDAYASPGSIVQRASALVEPGVHKKK